MSVPFQTILMGTISAVSAAGLACFLLSGNVLLATGGAGGVLVGIVAYVRRRIAKRNVLFESQLVDALKIVSRSLRAGHPALGAFQLVAEEMDEPVRGVFEQVCQQQTFGVDLGAALREAAIESRSGDFKMFAAAIGIALRSGGNLADMIDRLAVVIRDRIRLAARIRVLTSQARFSKNVLIIMPFAIGTILFLINGEYVQMLINRTEGQIMCAVAVASVGLGAFVMNRMVQLKY